MKRKVIGLCISAALLAAISLACIAPKTTQIIINSEPQGAMVFIDGDAVGQTPLKRDMTFKDAKKGRHLIQIKKEGYRPQQRYFLYTDNPNQLFQLDKLD